MRKLGAHMQPNVFKRLFFCISLTLFLADEKNWGAIDNTENISKSELLESNHLWIVEGDLVSTQNLSLGSVTYRVFNQLYGSLPTNMIDVHFFKNTLKKDIPGKAILILTVESIGSYGVVDFDAEHGVLEDTEATLALVKNMPLDKLLETPPEKKLPRESAQSIAEQYLIENSLLKNYIHWRFTRGRFGWNISANFGSEEHPDATPLHGDIRFYVGDDGEIKNVR